MRLLLIVVVMLWPRAAVAEIGTGSFRHRFIAREMPADNVGFGGSALADVDRDGDLDFMIVNRGDRKVYWFEFVSRDEWVHHRLDARRFQAGRHPLNALTLARQQ